MNPKNHCEFIGRLTKDPETKTFDSGSMTNFTIAVTRNFKNKEGKYDADFIECRAANKTGETIAKFFQKGTPIIVAGDLRNNNWTDRDGTKHYQNIVVVSDFAFPEAPKNSGQGTATAPVQSTPDPTFNSIPTGGFPGFQSMPPTDGEVPFT